MRAAARQENRVTASKGKQRRISVAQKCRAMCNEVELRASVRRFEPKPEGRPRLDPTVVNALKPHAEQQLAHQIDGGVGRIGGGRSGRMIKH
ncbi:hypothetical protein J2R81_007825 [Bradyrhizobium sp. USDA 4545]|nr:hypothetical protein [Bradyrhizobium sp. USDA 4545]